MTSPEIESTDATLIVAERRLARRRRGFWWAVAGMVGYLLLLVAVRFWWSQAAERRLAAQVAAYRAQGQPVRLEDFKLPRVSDRDNAAMAYKRALAALPTLKNANVSLMLEHAWRRAEWAPAAALMKEFLTRHQVSLDQLTEATSRPEVDWQVKVTSPVFNTLLPNLGRQRELTRLLMLDALDAHFRGDPARTLQRLDEALVLAQRVSIGMPFLISDLVGQAMQEYVFRAIEFQAHTFELNADPEVRTAAEALIQKLLETNQLREQHVRSILCERMGFIDSCEYLVANPSKGLSVLGIGGPWIMGRPYQACLAPAMNMDCAGLMDYYADFAYAPFNEPLPPEPEFLWPEKTDLVKQIAHFPTKLFLPSLGRTHTLTAERIARRRMAAIALALRLYVLDHGQRPPLLADLVPDYLPRVPLDPFDPNDATLRYLPDADSPRLYSVRVDGEDNGGEYEERKKDGITYEPRDLVFFLDESPLFTPPDPNDAALRLSETLDDDSEVEQAQAED